MKIEVSLFGAFRTHSHTSWVTLELSEGARVADLRLALADYGRSHWPDFHSALLQCSAFASETAVLCETDVLPADGRMAILPPVSGG